MLAPGCEIKLNLGSWNIPLLLLVLARISADHGANGPAALQVSCPTRLPLVSEEIQVPWKLSEEKI